MSFNPLKSHYSHYSVIPLKAHHSVTTLNDSVTTVKVTGEGM